MKDLTLNKIDDWLAELLSGSDQDKEKAQLLIEIRTELISESEALEKLSKRISSTEEELLKRLPIKTGDYAVATIDGEDKIGQISEIHTISLSPSLVIIALSPHFYPEYLMDIDKLRKPSLEEIEYFKSNRLNIKGDIERKEKADHE